MFGVLLTGLLQEYHHLINLAEPYLGAKTEVQNALSASLTRVLTPKTSTDILLDIQRKRSSALIDEISPYTMTFVGVNGVGKSTNLSKVCFWLLQNGYRVLIAACDTFRSGAVEQLRVHVRNLGALAEDLGERRIELFEKGYGKDAAGIAKDAITYGELSTTLLTDPLSRYQASRGTDILYCRKISTDPHSQGEQV